LAVGDASFALGEQAGAGDRPFRLDPRHQPRKSRKPIKSPPSLLLVLVADDNHHAGESLNLLLSLRGFDCKTADDGLEEPTVATSYT
jgi:hypothetical protein